MSIPVPALVDAERSLMRWPNNCKKTASGLVFPSEEHGISCKA